MAMFRMGERIKKRRENLGLQTSDLAGTIGVTPSLISQIERAKAYPSILTLKKIAEALQSTVGELIGESATFIENPHLNVKERKFAKNNDDGASVYLLSHHDPVKQMDPFIISFEPNGSSKEIMTSNNPRQEFCYLLSGKIEVQLNGQKYILKPGDSFYFISTQNHLFTNVSKEKAELLWIVNQSSV